MKLPCRQRCLRLLVPLAALSLLGAREPSPPEASILRVSGAEAAAILAEAPALVATPTRSAFATLWSDTADTRLDEHSLLDAALVAGGVEDAQVRARHAAQFDSWAAELQAMPEMNGGESQRAATVFAFLHRRILRGTYRAECPGLATTLESGDFDCLTSALLYVCLAEQCGLRAVGVEAPAHVIARVWIDGRGVDVETTCPVWWRAIAPPKEAAPRRELTTAGVAALVSFNRGLDLLARREFTEAVRANLTALRLDPANRAAQGNLLATLNNWALAAHAAGYRNEALAILERGRRLAPGFELFQVNRVAILQP